MNEVTEIFSELYEITFTYIKGLERENRHHYILATDMLDALIGAMKLAEEMSDSLSDKFVVVHVSNLRYLDLIVFKTKDAKNDIRSQI